MSGKPKSKASEAQQLLDDLESLGSTPVKKAPSLSQPTPRPPGGAGAAEALAFLDEMTQKSEEPSKSTLERPSSRSGTPTLRKSTERVKLGGGSSSSSLNPSTSKSEDATSKAKAAVAAANAATEQSYVSSESASPAGGGGGGWGWGSVWSTASAAIQQARTVVDEQVKHLPNNENARKVLEYAKTTQLDKLGQDFKRVGLSTLTDILNVVAPPISEHEIIQVWLSHDMQGYEGIESLVYRAMAKVLEQVQGGDLIVNRGEESKPRDGSSVPGRNLNTVEGYDAAVKMAKANLAELITANAKKPAPKPTSVESPTTYSNVYLRVQPFFTSLSSQGSVDGGESQSAQHLQFLLYFTDPTHELTHINLTQTIPSSWLAVWDSYDWIEDLAAEAIRLSVEVIGQDYLVQRMGWASQKQRTDKEAGEGHERDTSDVDKDTVLVGAES